MSKYFSVTGKKLKEIWERGCRKRGPRTVYVDPDLPSFRHLVLEVTAGRGLSVCRVRASWDGSLLPPVLCGVPAKMDGSPENTDKKLGWWQWADGCLALSTGRIRGRLEDLASKDDLQGCLSFIIIIFFTLFIWLCQVLLVAHRLFCCSQWDLVPWPGIKPGPPTLGMWRLSHWTTREVWDVHLKESVPLFTAHKVKWKSPSLVRLPATPWTIQSMAFTRPEYWSGYPFPSPGDLPNPGIEPRSPALQAYSLPAEPQGKPLRPIASYLKCRVTPGPPTMALLSKGSSPWKSYQCEKAIKLPHSCTWSRKTVSILPTIFHPLFQAYLSPLLLLKWSFTIRSCLHPAVCTQWWAQRTFQYVMNYYFKDYLIALAWSALLFKPSTKTRK